MLELRRHSAAPMHTVLLFSCLFICFPVGADEAQTIDVKSALNAANRLYSLHKFKEADNLFKSLLTADAKLTLAQAGHIRALLQLMKLDEASEAANAALLAQPKSPDLLTVKGDVQFRRGEMADAEASYRAALNLDSNAVGAQLGLGQLYGAYSFYRRSYDHIKKAHELAPDGLEVEIAWINTLPRKTRLAAMESYIAAEKFSPDEVKSLAPYMSQLKLVSEMADHPCRLVSKAGATETKLNPVTSPHAKRPRAVGLSAKINNQNVLLEFDTGAPGILLDRNLAEKMKLSRLSDVPVVGYGGRGVQGGYSAIAGHLQIGDLEFEDCVVVVAEAPGGQRWAGSEGVNLIGATVFENYLIDIDLAGMRLRLSPLPKRPGEQSVPSALSTGTVDESDELPTEGVAESPEAGGNLQTPALPEDRYVAPEMSDWTRAFRFGHMVLVPTRVNGSKPLLFMLDTGAVASMLSVHTGRETSKISEEERLRLAGMSGYVEKVYTSRSATLQFGRLEQKNKDIATIDLSTMSRAAGTELSGVLGFEALLLLDVKLDYRDGLVDFNYDPKTGTR